ncbi:MAG: TonB-dependent receptor [Opitutaceae bacterium]|nr:TonB-dependent receptor [Opitutaceae bacterium]
MTVVLLLIGAGLPSARAAEAGSISGRVFSPGTGEYLERARVTIAGSDRETFTDNLGQYQFASVPAGVVNVVAFYTGLKTQTAAVHVATGQMAQHDFELVGFGPKPAAGEVVKLDQFVVSTSRDMDGAAIAINEQRFAPNIKNVISADEFGPVVDGNIGELLKFIPGVTLDYIDGAPMGISMNGVPADNVPVTVGGFNLASAQNETNRKVELVNISTNTVSRIEVLYTPTPESPGMALAGSVNLVPRSAFERSKPIFNTSAYVLARSHEHDFDRTPGPGLKATRKVNPGFDFSYIAPISKRLGFTLSGGTSTQYQPTLRIRRTWRGTGSTTNGTAYPDPAPDQPYLTQFSVEDSPFTATRSAAGATVDYRLGPNDRISLSVQGTYFDMQFNKRQLRFVITQAQPGALLARSSRSTAGGGSIDINNSDIDRTGISYMPTLRYWHTGPIWKADAGLAYSYSDNLITNRSGGYFSTASTARTGVTVSFDDINELRPRTITVTDAATGALVDPYDIHTYALSGAANNSNTTTDLQRSAYVNVARDFFGRVPCTLKAGLDVRHSARDFSRDPGETANAQFTFVGRDGRASTTPTAPGSDDSAAAVLDENLYSLRTPPFGFPRVQYVDSAELLQLYRTNPLYFTTNPDTTYRNVVQSSRYAEELISSAYLRGDVALFDRRLKLIGGVRAEQTNVKAQGPLTDPTRNYQRDATGNVIRGANGRALPITTVPLEVSKLTLIERGTQVNKEYLRFFPSLNAAFNVRDNLIARAAYYTSVGRPNFSQYSGGLTLPDPDASPTSNSYRIRVNNAGIKAWNAKTFKVMLEYYFERVGLLSIGAFRRDTKDFFGNITFPSTPEFLALYDLDPAEYGQYEVVTQHNVPGTIRMDGLDFNYKQALTFLPNWARGVQIFANGSWQKKTGDTRGIFNGVTRTTNAGISLSRDKFNLRINWNLRPRQRGQLNTGRGIAPDTYQWTRERLYTDINGDYRLSRRFALFASIRNVFNTPEGAESAGPETPENAFLTQYVEYGSLWTLGIKGTF